MSFVVPDIDPKVARSAIRECWVDIIDSIKDPVDFANQLKTVVPYDVYEIAIDRHTGQSAKERVTRLLCSVETVISHQGQYWNTLCDIVRTSDGAVADRLWTTYYSHLHTG